MLVVLLFDDQLKATIFSNYFATVDTVDNGKIQMRDTCNTSPGFLNTAHIVHIEKSLKLPVLNNKKAVLSRKGTARCRSFCFWFKVRRQHSLQV